ncbi:MAG: TIGR01777 family oxidoreductase [Mycobacteriaceae bacterium]
MKVLIAGSSGLLGTALVPALRSQGHTVQRLVRRTPRSPDELGWDPALGEVNFEDLQGFNAVINLCGVGIGDRRWSGSFKQQIRDSRIGSTEVMATAVAHAKISTLINASAVGFYGDTGNLIVDESEPNGTGFLAELCKDWEQATGTAAAAGARVIQLRTGVVLSPYGGLLKRLKPLYSLGFGGRLGNGRQYFPWISLVDQIRAISFLLTDSTLSGPVNLTGPAPVTNSEFNLAFAKAMHRPAPWVVPKVMLTAILGDFASEGALISQRVIPAALENDGFRFQHNTIGSALDAALLSTSH